jgi:predicted nucleic acid-binding protein
LRWRNYASQQTYSPKVWNDAYLAAFAAQSGIELVSFDRGLAGYADLACTILT